MAAKKERLPVVLDTNVLIANYLSTNLQSPNVVTVRLWRERKLQIIVSDEIADEYIDVLIRLGVSETLVANFATSLNESGTVTHVNLGNGSPIALVQRTIRFSLLQPLDGRNF